MFYCPKDHVTLKTMRGIVCFISLRIIYTKDHDGNIMCYCPKDHVTLRIMMGTLS